MMVLKQPEILLLFDDIEQTLRRKRSVVIYGYI